MDDLARLAALYGVATTYQPAEDVTVRVPEATIAAVLRQLGVDTDTPESVRSCLAGVEREAADRVLPRVLVWWAGSRPPAELGALPPGTLLSLEPEEEAGEPGAPGEAVPLREPGGALREPPLGVHRLHAEAPDGRTASATLIVAPDRAPAAPERTHGLLVQLYSLLSERSWGMGDLGDLAALASWAGRVHGAGFIQVNPLHAAVPGTPTDPSPYRPSSRRFPDPVHLRIEDVPEYADCPDREALAELAARGGSCAARYWRRGRSSTGTPSGPSSGPPWSCSTPSRAHPNGRRTTGTSAPSRARSSTCTPPGAPGTPGTTRRPGPTSTAGWSG